MTPFRRLGRIPTHVREAFSESGVAATGAKVGPAVEHLRAESLGADPVPRKKSAQRRDQRRWFTIVDDAVDVPAVGALAPIFREEKIRVPVVEYPLQVTVKSSGPGRVRQVDGEPERAPATCELK